MNEVDESQHLNNKNGYISKTIDPIGIKINGPAVLTEALKVIIS
jgi:hypothetical protein